MFEAVKADAFTEPKVLNRGRILVVATKEEEGRFIPPRNESREHTLVASLLGESNW